MLQGSSLQALGSHHEVELLLRFNFVHGSGSDIGAMTRLHGGLIWTLRGTLMHRVTELWGDFWLSLHTNGSLEWKSESGHVLSRGV